MEKKIYAPVDEVRRRLGSLEYKTGNIIKNAANRAITTGRKVIRQETANTYNLKNQKEVEEDLNVRRATSSFPSAILTYKGSHKNLYDFGNNSVVNPRFPIKSSSKYNPDPPYIAVKVMRNEDAVALTGRPKPFVQEIPNSEKIAVFQRENDNSDAEIRGVSAPAIPQIVRNETTIERFDKEAGEMFEERIEHEITRVLEGH